MENEVLRMRVRVEARIAEVGQNGQVTHSRFILAPKDLASYGFKQFEVTIANGLRPEAVNALSNDHEFDVVLVRRAK